MVPVTHGKVTAEYTAMKASKEVEDGWLGVMHLLDKEKLDPTDYVSWEAYHALQNTCITHCLDAIGS